MGVPSIIVAKPGCHAKRIQTSEKVVECIRELSDNKMTMFLNARKLLLFGVLLTFCIGVGGVTAQPGRGADDSVTAGEKRDDLIPDFSFNDLAGKAHKFSEYKGKIVLVDFWATWCGPCLADIPKLKGLREKYGPQGFDILGMNAETSGDQESNDAAGPKEAAIAAKRIVATRGAVWTHADAVTALPVAIKIFDVKTLPTKVLIGRDGKVIAKIGAKDDLEKIVSEQLAAK